MNDQLRAAVERLFAACLSLTLAGKYHAHMDYAAHCGKVSVDVYPAATRYTIADMGAPMLAERIYIHEATLTPDDATEQIEALIVRLGEYQSEAP